MFYSRTLSAILNKWPGKKTFGVYRFLPVLFITGAALEWVMINARIAPGRETFCKSHFQSHACNFVCVRSFCLLMFNNNTVLLPLSWIKSIYCICTWKNCNGCGKMPLRYYPLFRQIIEWMNFTCRATRARAETAKICQMKLCRWKRSNYHYDYELD